jgi:hypothetical protein
MDMAVGPVKVAPLSVLPATAQRTISHEGNIAPQSYKYISKALSKLYLFIYYWREMKSCVLSECDQEFCLLNFLRCGGF